MSASDPTRGGVGALRIPAAAGCYALLLQLERETRLDVGRLGQLDFSSGYYIYVGSAFGPGGLRARLNRHWLGGRRRHWHIDYLRAAARPVAAWYQVQQSSREHEWAATLARGRGLEPVAKFGATDCGCASHLYRSNALPAFDGFRRRLGSRQPGDGQVKRFQP